MLNRIKEQFEKGGKCALAPAVSGCLFAHEYDEAGGALELF